MLKVIGLLLLSFIFPVVSYAYVPTFVYPATQDAVIPIMTPTVLNTFYGDLQGYPHLYTLNVDRPSTLQIHLMVPDIRSAENDKSVIIVKRKQRGVVEVARMNFKDASWAPVTDYATGDRYRIGGSYSNVVDPGTYNIEVSTAVDMGKYVVQISATPTASSSTIVPSRGYFTTLGDIYKIKHFFGKPAIAVFESPFYYVPSVLIILATLLVWVYYRKRRIHSHA